jgi:hypothetical protein
VATHDDTPISDSKGNEVNNEDLGQDMRDDLGLDNQQDDDN